MGVQVPRTSRELLRGDVHPVQRAVSATPYWLVVSVVVALAYMPVALRVDGPAPYATLPWLVAPLLAAAAWGRAAVRVLGRPRLAFWALAAAAAVVVAAQLVWAYETYLFARPGVPRALYLMLAPHLLIAAGAGLAIGQRRGSVWTPSLTADVMLLMLMAAVGTLRLVVEQMMDVGVAVHREVALLAMLQSIALVPLLVTGLLVLRGGSVLAPRAAVYLLAATAVFSIGTLLSLTGLDPRPFVLGDPFDWTWVAGWLLYAAAGVRARSVAATAPAMLEARRAQDAIRRLVVPAAALFLTAFVVDLAVRGEPRPETVVAVALLGGLLALRMSHALSIATEDAAQKRQLAHTRALVAVTHSLAGTTELDEALRVISESARDVFGTEGAGIELLTKDGRALETRAAVGLPANVMGLRFPLDGSFTGWTVQHGEPRATVDPSRDPYIQPQSLSFLGPHPVAAAPIRFGDETMGALFACIRSEPFDAEELHLLGALAEQAAIAIKNARLFEQVTILSVTDPLTGLSNRRQLERELEREFAAARRGRKLSAVIFDLDDFKDYNDTHGHLAGDEALQAFAQALRDETRAMNLAARYGGDEFVALLSDTDGAGARAFVERVRKRFTAAALGLGREEIQLSAGIAVYSPEMQTPDELLRRADAELYRVKARVRR